MSEESGAEPGGERRISFWDLPLVGRVLVILGVVFVFAVIVRALTPRPVVSSRMPEPLNDRGDVDEPVVIIVARSDFTRAVHDIAERNAPLNGKRPRATRARAEEVSET